MLFRSDIEGHKHFSPDKAFLNKLEVFRRDVPDRKCAPTIWERQLPVEND
jgi:hypothetical protein